MSQASMLQPLLLTLLGAAGTGFGGLMVVLQPHMNFRRLGALQVRCGAVSAAATMAQSECAAEQCCVAAS